VALRILRPTCNSTDHNVKLSDESCRKTWQRDTGTGARVACFGQQRAVKSPRCRDFDQHLGRAPPRPFASYIIYVTLTKAHQTRPYISSAQPATPTFTLSTMSLLGRAPVDSGLQQNTNFAACPWALTSTSSGPEPVLDQACNGFLARKIGPLRH
jgi:hypothetical protein